MFNGVFSRNNLPRITEDGGYIINLDDKGRAGTHWVAVHINGDQAVYFNSFGIEHLPEEILKFVRNKHLRVNIFRAQSIKSFLCGYYCIQFLEFMFNGKTLIDYTSLFSPTDFKENDKVVLKLFGIK